MERTKVEIYMFSQHLAEICSMEIYELDELINRKKRFISNGAETHLITNLDKKIAEQKREICEAILKTGM